MNRDWPGRNTPTQPFHCRGCGAKLVMRASAAVWCLACACLRKAAIKRAHIRRMAQMRRRYARRLKHDQPVLPRMPADRQNTPYILNHDLLRVG